MKELDWYGLYAGSWKNEIVDSAFQHPAKYSRFLIKRIYAHALAQGYIKPGDTVLDPFGGVALGGLDAMRHGLHWIGVELESKFVELGQQNIELWQRKYADRVEMWGLNSWGTAVILQGDSRELGEVLARVDSVIGSPPFGGSLNDGLTENDRVKYAELTRCGRGVGTSYGNNPANLGNLPATDAQFNAAIGSPPYAGSQQVDNRDAPVKITGSSWKKRQGQITVGHHPDNLGAMPEGSHTAVIGSPPYAESIASDDPDKRGGLYRDPKRRNDKTLTAEYGDTEGQLGRMSVVSSPPFENQSACNDPNYRDDRINPGGPLHGDYGDTAGNIGNTTGQDFWQAARQIMEQVATILPPGSVAIWVLKGFVRSGKYVDFPTQWKQLGEACGFKTLKWIRAWLIEDKGAQYTLGGELEEREIQRKSFFRRLAESKGSPPVDFEVVLVQRRMA